MLPEEQSLNSSLLKHLIRTWESFPTRAFPRHSVSGNIQASAGLGSTHHFLNQGNDVLADINTSTNKLRKIKTTYNSFDWQVLNSSDNGYCLCTTDDFPETIQVGEIIGLQEDNDQNSAYWHVGTIRWMQYTHDHKLQIGVQILAPNGIPVAIRSLQQQMQDSDFLRALMLPEAGSNYLAQTIVTPSYLYTLVTYCAS